MVSFLTMISIKQNEHLLYESQMKEYIMFVKKLYTVGGKSFLTSGNDVGKEEIVYMHVLRFYIPYIAKIIFDKHGLVVGIFTM